MRSIYVGADEKQGLRKTMEDAIDASLHVPTGFRFLAIFDGHGGAECSSALAGKTKSVMGPLHDIVFMGLQRLSVHERHNPETITRLLDMSCLRWNAASVYAGWDSGSTAIIALLDDTLNHLWICNVGDSKAQVWENKRLIFESAEHKPTNPIELKRIEAAGGTVVHGRIQGILNVGRAFGDWAINRSAVVHDPSPDQAIVDSSRWVVSASPTITYIPLSSKAEYHIINACDGLHWYPGGGRPQTDPRRIQDIMLSTPAHQVCAALTSYALKTVQSQDNVSVLHVHISPSQDFR